MQPINSKTNKQLQCRLKILQYAIDSKEGHIASSYSIVDLLIAILEVQRTLKSDSALDSLILSKGHAVFALYSVMASYGFLTETHEKSIAADGSGLIGHVPVLPELGFHYGTGSLGQGLPYAIGLAYKRLANGNSNEVYVIVGDGEMNEGSCWESLLLLKKFPNIPLRLIIDCNGSSERALPIMSLLNAIIGEFQNATVNGHDINSIVDCLQNFDRSSPAIIICNTTKGHPIGEMQLPLWHHKTPSESQVEEFSKILTNYYS